MEKVLGYVKKYWLTVAFGAGLVLLYKYISDNKVFGSMMFPTIGEIWAAFVSERTVMLKNMLASFGLLIPSIGITLVIALVVGVVLGMSQYLRNALHPFIYAFSCVPAILLSPFVILIAGNFWISSIFLIFYGTVWATLFATITGIETIDKRYLDNARTLELKGVKLMFKVILPAASPSIIGGFVNSLRSSFVMLVFAEMYGASFGLGFYVRRYFDYGLYANVWAGFLFMVLVLVCVMMLFEQLKNYLLKWTA